MEIILIRAAFWHLKLRERELTFEKYLQCANFTNGMPLLNPHASTRRQRSIIKARTVEQEQAVKSYKSALNLYTLSSSL